MHKSIEPGQTRAICPPGQTLRPPAHLQQQEHQQQSLRRKKLTTKRRPYKSIKVKISVYDLLCCCLGADEQQSRASQSSTCKVRSDDKEGGKNKEARATSSTDFENIPKK